MNLDLLKDEIEKIEGQKHLIKIFKIIHANNEKYISNDSGVFIPLNIYNNETLKKVDEYIKSIDKHIIKADDVKQNFKNLDFNKSTLPRHEQLILNKFHFNKDD